MSELIKILYCCCWGFHTGIYEDYALWFVTLVAAYQNFNLFAACFMPFLYFYLRYGEGKSLQTLVKTRQCHIPEDRR
jgi:hypothetical protein